MLTAIKNLVNGRWGVWVDGWDVVNSDIQFSHKLDKSENCANKVWWKGGWTVGWVGGWGLKPFSGLLIAIKRFIIQYILNLNRMQQIRVEMKKTQKSFHHKSSGCLWDF